MNKLQRDLVEFMWTQECGEERDDWTGYDHDVCWRMRCEKALESNITVFCEMPEWMKKAMCELIKIDDVNVLQWRDDDGWKKCACNGIFGDSWGIEFAYRLNPDYVFEEDAPKPGEELPKDGGLTSEWVDIEVEGMGMSRMICYRKHEIALSIAPSYDDFIGFVYNGLGDKILVSPTARLSLGGNKPALIPIAVRFAQ